MSPRGYRLLYLSGYGWGNLGRRKVRLAWELARKSEVSGVLYVEPPTATSLIDLVRGRFGPDHLPPTRRAHLNALLGRPRRADGKVQVLTGSDKIVPLTRFETIRRWRALQRINRALYASQIRAALRKLGPGPIILWLTYPLQAWALDTFRGRALCCYDWTDDWTAFDVLPVADREELERLNRRVLQEADLVFAVSESLFQRARTANPNTYRAPNATDLTVVGRAAEPGPVAPELRHLPRPIVGYVGQIADKIDYDLLASLVDARPGWSFVFVGNVWDNHRHQVAALSERPNVHFLGPRDFERLPAYLRGFDVCILPHRVTPLTRSMDPIKLYDYLATGKPIVSTPVAGVERFADVVYVADGAEAFATALEAALQENPELRRRRLAYARENTWTRRGEEIWTVICSRLKERAYA
ncbi:MAG TPA: glycosyltransferase family 1 protein [Chloroflexi bacterium]|nr:glycosyltransferase family 1 protein [Chloroflexota bacterium]